MTAYADFHVHTTFCDGKNTPEEMVCAALAQGMTAIGFSGHSHLAFDESWCMSADGTARYRAEIARLREVYAGRIRILCGVEQDFYSDTPAEGYDYVIGVVHCLRVPGGYISVDESPQALREAAERCFGGDMYALAEAYYDTVAQVCEVTHCDVIGHFDLVSKFNENGTFFDESHPRYTAAWQQAAKRLLETGKLFELNTGAISRGWRSVPYPNPAMLPWLIERGARFLLSGDSHSADTLCCEFPRWETELRALGAPLAHSPN